MLVITEKCNPVLSSWDSTVIRELKGIHVPFGWLHHKQPAFPSLRDSVQWFPPTRGSVKVNFDGSSRGNPGKSGFGICIRDHHGEVLAIKASPIPSGTKNMAEAYVLFKGLILAKKGGYQSIQIEGDSMVIINTCIRRESHNWKLSYIIQQIWLFFDSFKVIHISHTLREGNMLADFLANIGCDGMDFEDLNPGAFIKSNREFNRLMLKDIKNNALSSGNARSLC